MQLPLYITDFEDDEDGNDNEEQVVIHKKGRALKKFDGNGKSKKKSKVIVEVSFPTNWL